MYSVDEVAQYFINKSYPYTMEEIRLLKLHKLLYYAQVFTFIFTKEVLFYEKIEAWCHGPVIPSIHNKYKESIPNILHPEKNNPNRPYSFDSKTLAILDTVWKVYGKYSNAQLEYFVHREDPWILAKKNQEQKFGKVAMRKSLWTV